MHDEAVFKATNSMILGQIHQPPPSVVLTGLVETIGGEPDVVGATVDWGDNKTTWDVYACRGDIVVRVHAKKAVRDWYGGGMHDRPGGLDPAVTTTALRISDAKSVGAENLMSIPTFEGFSRESRAKWVVLFDGVKLELDEHLSRYGVHLGNVARHIRSRFVESEPQT